MKTTHIFIKIDAEQYLIDEQTCVNYVLTNENCEPILHSFTMDELESLDDERLASVMLGLDVMKALFEKVIENRNDKSIKIAQDLESMLEEPVRVQAITRVNPTGNTKKL